jgi:hypothetical protein
MTPEETRLQLDACTLRPQDAAPDARAALEADPEMRDWWAARQAFDKNAADAVAAVPLPEGLREKLLALAPVPPVAAGPRRRGKADFWLTALAGALVLTVAGVAWWNPSPGEMPEWQEQTLAMVKKIEAGDVQLDHFSRDLTHIKAILGQGNHPRPADLPGGFASIESLGCKSFVSSGREATIVCFEIAPGMEGHLVIMNSEGLREHPPSGQPQFVSRGEWNIARWSDGKQCYLMATRAPREELKRLFAVLRLWQ